MPLLVGSTKGFRRNDWSNKNAKASDHVNTEFFANVPESEDIAFKNDAPLKLTIRILFDQSV